jgi:hypothetical protein
MVTLEQVEKLREYANISYDEAKAALENAGGDILQAIIDLERQGKINPPQGGGQYSSGSIEVSANQQKEEFKKEKSQSKSNGGEKSAFNRNMGRFFRWMCDILHKGNVNAMVVEKNGASIMRLPITVLVILLICAFWIVVPLLVVGLFFNFRYFFQGPDIQSTKMNDAMNTVANAAEEIKNDIRS